MGTPAGITEKATSAALAPWRRMVARPSPWIVQRRSTGAPAAGFALSSIGAIAPSTLVSTTPGSPRTTSTESSYAVMVFGAPEATSITTGGRPAYGGGSIQASIRLPAAASVASPPRQSKAAARRP